MTNAADKIERLEQHVSEWREIAIREGRMWQPVETAPKFGTFLVYAPITGSGLPYCAGHSHTAVMHRAANITLVDAHFGFDMPEPTHWMPLPEPPNG